MNETDIKSFYSMMTEENADRIIISKPAGKNPEYRKIVIEKKAAGYQIARYTEKQVFHENISAEELAEKGVSLTQGEFQQITAWAGTQEYTLLISRKGSCTLRKSAVRKSAEEKTEDAGKCQTETVHNRKKEYVLEEGTMIEPLIDMGIFTKEGKIVRSMYDKYRQINRFLEILDDEIGKRNMDSLHVIDFGCGKSYLTFVVYYYLTHVRKIRTQMIGLDLKAEVIRKCNAAAEKYGYDGLRFELGDINGFQSPFPVDMVITLHACDTATDYALYNAVRWNASMIFSVPCCQHELNAQIRPQSLSILTRYGIIKERFSALATDAIRGNLLEYAGYRTQLLEFIDLEHTPKNILIRAVRRPVTPESVRKKARAEAEALMQEFCFRPALYQLLEISGDTEETIQK